MNISIVIPNFNGRELLEKNLPKVLAAKKNKSNKISEVIIVDDGSSDHSVAFLKEQFKDNIRLIVHSKNRGFSASINMGVRAAKGELVCLLNTDVVPEADFLVTMDENFNDESVFGVSLHEKGYGYAKGRFSGGFIVHEGVGESKKVEETFWASGGSSVLRRSVFMDLRGMDDELLSPFYWEDIDLSYRAQKRGYRVIWDPRARVIHEHESTVKKLNQKYVQRIRERNQLLFIWKNLTSRSLFRKHIISLVKRTVKHPGYIVIVVMALGRFGKMLEARKREVKETKVADEAVFAKF